MTGEELILKISKLELFLEQWYALLTISLFIIWFIVSWVNAKAKLLIKAVYLNSISNIEGEIMRIEGSTRQAHEALVDIAFKIEDIDDRLSWLAKDIERMNPNRDRDTFGPLQ